MRDNRKRKIYIGGEELECEAYLGDVNEQELAKESACLNDSEPLCVGELEEKNDMHEEGNMPKADLHGQRDRVKVRILGGAVCSLACAVCFLCAFAAILQFLRACDNTAHFSQSSADVFENNETEMPTDKEPEDENDEQSEDNEESNQEENQENANSNKLEGAHLGIVGEDAVIDETCGVRILSFADGIVPAADMLKTGDLIIAVNGKSTPDSSSLLAALSELLPNDKAEILVIREGHSASFFVNFVK